MTYVFQPHRRVLGLQTQEALRWCEYWGLHSVSRDCVQSRDHR